MNYFILPGIKKEAETVSIIQQAFAEKVCRHFGIALSRLQDRAVGNYRTTTLPRHIIMYGFRIKYGLSWRIIGQYFKRDHTTAIYAAQQIDKLIETNAPERDEILMLLDI